MGLCDFGGVGGAGGSREVKGGRNSRVSMTSPRILRSESCLGKGPLEGSPQQGASETTHLSQVPGEGRGARRVADPPPNVLRGSNPTSSVLAPLCRDVRARGPVSGRPRRLARSRLVSGWRGGLQKLEEQVTMDAVALSNHGSGKPCQTLEVKEVKDNRREMAR